MKGTGIWEGQETFAMPVLEDDHYVYKKLGIALKLYVFLFYKSDELGKTVFKLNDAEATEGTGIKNIARARKRLINEKLIQFTGGCYGLCDHEGKILPENWTEYRP